MSPSFGAPRPGTLSQQPGALTPLPRGPRVPAGAAGWCRSVDTGRVPSHSACAPVGGPAPLSSETDTGLQCDRVDEVQKCVLGEKGARGAFSEASDSRMPAAGGRGGRGLGGGVLRDAAAASRALAEPVPGCCSPSSRRRLRPAHGSRDARARRRLSLHPGTRGGSGYEPPLPPARGSSTSRRIHASDHCSNSGVLQVRCARHGPVGK